MIRRIEVEFVECVYLPRFKMAIGATWQLSPDRMQKDGFTLGGGFVKNSDFKIISIIRRLAS